MGSKGENCNEEEDEELQGCGYAVVEEVGDAPEDATRYHDGLHYCV